MAYLNLKSIMEVFMSGVLGREKQQFCHVGATWIILALLVHGQRRLLHSSLRLATLHFWGVGEDRNKCSEIIALPCTHYNGQFRSKLLTVQTSSWKS